MIKRILFLAVIGILLSATMAFSQTATSSSTSSSIATGIGGDQHQGQGQSMTNTVDPTQTNSQRSKQSNAQSMSLQQNSTAPDAGMGRLFPFPVQPPMPPLTPYFGPWTSGWNNLEELRWFWPIITMEEANNLYQSSVKSEPRFLGKKPGYRFEVCHISVAGPNGETPKGAKSIGMIFLKGSGATTVDVIAKAAIIAMENGGNGIVIIKNKVQTKAKARGLGLGLGHVVGTLGGQGDTVGNVSSGGFGYSWGTAEPEYSDGIVVSVIQTAEAQETLKNCADKKKKTTKNETVKIDKVASINPSAQKVGLVMEEVKADPFRCIATGTYTPPPDCK